MQIDRASMRGLTVTSSMAWNSSEQTNSPSLMNNNPYSQSTGAAPYTGVGTSSYGQPITAIPNVYGAAGQPPRESPPFEGSTRVRYEWNHERLPLVCPARREPHGATLSQTGNVNAFVMPGLHDL